MKYRRVIATDFGGPEVLQIIEDTIPEPQGGEILVKVLTAGVAYGEVARRQAPSPFFPPPPYTPGYDIVGIVEKVGVDVTELKIGQRVAGFAFSPDYTRGGYAEYVCLPAWRFVTVPEEVDSAEAVCLVVNYLTAYQMLHRTAKVKGGEKVLIHGAAGGVGTALLQLGKLAGLEMYGTASASKHTLIHKLGGIPIDYKNEDFVERIFSLTRDGVDIVFDGIAGDYVERSYSVLRKNGQLIVYGLTSMNPKDFMDKLMPEIERIGTFNNRVQGKAAVVFGIDEDNQRDLYREDLRTLLDLLAHGKIRPVIAERLPLEMVDKAHQLIEKSAIQGKIVLELE